jgi:hypothetical protein
MPELSGSFELALSGTSHTYTDSIRLVTRAANKIFRTAGQRIVRVVDADVRVDTDARFRYMTARNAKIIFRSG